MPVLLIATCLLGTLVHAVPPVEGDAVAVALLDAGDSPRRVLRLAHPPGWDTAATLRVSPEVETTLGTGADQELRTEYGPEISVPLQVAWASEAGSGRARYRVRVGRPEVRAVDEEGAETAWRLAEALGAMSGREGVVVLSGTGQLVQGGLALGVGASSDLSAWVGAALSSEWFTTPQFPESPVGPGARWAVARTRGPGGLAVVAYELVALHRHHGRVRFQVHTRRPEGAAAPVAEGELRFDLRQPFPSRLEAVFTSSTELLTEGPRRLVVTRRARVSLERGGSLASFAREVVAAPWAGEAGEVRAR
ncbi:hypothetical protein A176_001086 [Myxococcus hansupus]|uniref:Lipoprotein n=1 Tax=Pseudomyxococcus hansupus TaxID=1297742 RepID=A0A0H4WN28_9BACT|nr:hypothetical protein [Myxococcus hansupus]AKQ64174.1 hypothetical protein A176_001086 [Myxococcus hansupus]